MEMKRREFLTRSIAGAGGLLLGTRFAEAGVRKGGKCDPYERVPLGKTKIKVSRVGFGTGMRGGGRQSNHTRMGQEKFNALARGCYERGIRLFDVADMYGTHPYLAVALKEMPRKDFVATRRHTRERTASCKCPGRAFSKRAKHRLRRSGPVALRRF